MRIDPTSDIVSLALERALAGVTERQRVIASNVANASTPGYRAQRVDFEASLGRAMSAGDPAQAQIGRSLADTPVKADGNSVDLTTEMTQMGQAGLLYDALVAATNYKISSVRAALSR